MSVLSAPHFHNEEAAYAYVEARLWPRGPVCPKCGATEEHVGKLAGKTTRIGLYKCYACRAPFTVKIGTIFEDSHCPLRFWLQAIHLLCASKKGISTRQLQRMLGVGMKTAWFLGHRIREAMKLGNLPPMGGPVQVDETYFGVKDDYRGKSRREKKGLSKKMAVVALVSADGSSRAFHVDYADGYTVRQIVAKNVAAGSTIHTDESTLYKNMGAYGIKREAVNHSHGTYVRRDGVTTNAVENFFSVFKRGMKGVYQHCTEKHLHRYVTEFNFRYSNRSGLGVEDVQRADLAILGAKGKRLTYATSRSAKAEEA